jgi:putative flippase GtrA
MDDREAAPTGPLKPAGLILGRLANAGERLVACAATSDRVLQFIRYASTSGVALAADMGVFVALTATALAASVTAAAIGYLTGAVLHYVLSVRFVYDAQGTGKSHRRLLTEFLATGLLGLALTAAIVWTATEIVGLAPIVGKALAVLVTFVSVYAARTALVFAARPAQAAQPAQSL